MYIIHMYIYIYMYICSYAYICTHMYIYIYMKMHTKKTAGKWQKCNLVLGMASVASNMGWL